MSAPRPYLDSNAHLSQLAGHTAYAMAIGGADPPVDAARRQDFWNAPRHELLAHCRSLVGGQQQQQQRQQQQQQEVSDRVIVRDDYGMDDATFTILQKV